MLDLLSLIGYGVYLGCVLLTRLVPLAMVFRLGKSLGLMAYYLLPRRRQLAVTNLESALKLNRHEAREMARKHFALLGANLLSMLKIPTMSQAAMDRHVTFQIDPQVPAEREARGWIAVLSHMGNWELPGSLTRLFPQFRFGAIYQKLANRMVNRHFNASRARMGVRLFDRGEEFWNAIAFLQSGGVLGVLVDQYAGVSGTWMPFFNRLTSTSTLAAALSERTGAELIPVRVTTTGTAQWRVHVGFPLPREATPEATSYAINQELESQIRASPADWLWTHDRWKTPQVGFLFTASQRRCYLPLGITNKQLTPYRILVRSAPELSEAKLAAPAVEAIKRGRPDVHLTVICPDNQTSLWSSHPAVDEVLAFSARETVFQIARRIRSGGRAQVGILLSPQVRGAWEMLLAGVPYLLGPPRRRFLNNWKNPPGMADPANQGEDRYRRIAAAAGADMANSNP